MAEQDVSADRKSSGFSFAPRQMTEDTIASSIASNNNRRRTQVLLLAVSLGFIALLGLGLINLEQNKLEVQISVDKTDIDQSGNINLEGLTYSGVTRDGNKFRLMAVTASENTEFPDKVLMTSPSARVETQTGKLMTIEADEGDFLRNRNMIKLKGSVVIKRTGGYTLTTDEAVANLDTGIMTSKVPVEGFSPNARINSDGMIITGDIRDITFTGNSTMAFNESPRTVNNAENSPETDAVRHEDGERSIIAGGGTISADDMIVYNRDDRLLVATGAAEVRLNNGRRLTGDRIEADLDEEERNFTAIRAIGNASIYSPKAGRNQEAQADRIVYASGSDIAILTGSVIILSDGNRMTGDKAEIDTISGNATLTSTGGRVGGVFAQ